jgi:hypothetical protein
MFNPPQNFASYRQSEMDTARVSTFSSIEQYPYISKRFAMERFLGLSIEEIARNEKLWAEENEKKIDVEPKGSDLRSIGISTSDIQTDLETGEQAEQAEQEPTEGPEVAGPVTPPEAAPPAAGGAAPVPPPPGGI